MEDSTGMDRRKDDRALAQEQQSIGDTYSILGAMARESIAKDR